MKDFRVIIHAYRIVVVTDCPDEETAKEFASENLDYGDLFLNNVELCHPAAAPAQADARMEYQSHIH